MPDIDLSSGVWVLFTSAFISSTIAPGGSEAVLAYMVSQTEISPLRLLAVATLGNTLGALTTWFLGRLAATGYPFERLAGNKHRRSLAAVQQWGSAALLFSWLPVIGDGFCLAAGWLRLSFYKSVAAIMVGKTLRYSAVIYVFHGPVG